jgi:hypothetical protein
MAAKAPAPGERQRVVLKSVLQKKRPGVAAGNHRGDPPGNAVVSRRQAPRLLLLGTLF